MADNEVNEIRCAVALEPEEFRQGPGRLVGRLLRYGEEIVHTRGKETFESRSLQWGPDGIVLFDGHDSQPRKPVGIMHPIQSDTEARINYSLPDSAAGRRIASSVRRGEQKGMSVEFRGAEERRDRSGLRRISKAWVTGAAVVADPAYKTATIELRAKRRRRLWL